jgi:hypothetical protein
MNRFFNNMFGTKFDVTRRQHQSHRNTISFQVEALEGRMLLAARVTPMGPVVQIQDQPATALHAKLPGTFGAAALPNNAVILNVEGGSATDKPGSKHDQMCKSMGQTANSFRQLAFQVKDVAEANQLFGKSEDIQNEMLDKGCFVVNPSGGLA